MTNFEKYKDEILKIVTENHSSLAKKDGAVVSCMEVSCKECDFDAVGICGENRLRWLYEDDGEEPDGCDGCKYEYKGEDESPCTECCNNYTSKWKYKPKKTRQSEFLKMFPNAELAGSVINICPEYLDENYDRCGNYEGKPCIECQKDYWLQEVEE